MTKHPDVTILDEGSVVMFYPQSVPARDWVEENVALESWQWLGGGFGVEYHYADALIDGMQDAGLTVEGR